MDWEPWPERRAWDEGGESTGRRGAGSQNEGPAPPWAWGGAAPCPPCSDTHKLGKTARPEGTLEKPQGGGRKQEWWLLGQCRWEQTRTKFWRVLKLVEHELATSPMWGPQKSTTLGSPTAGLWGGSHPLLPRFCYSAPQRCPSHPAETTHPTAGTERFKLHNCLLAVPLVAFYHL